MFVDSAGVRDSTNDEIEAIGIFRAKAAFERADIILWLGPEGAGPKHPCLIEIEAKADEATHSVKGGNAFRLSAHTGEGLTELIDAIILMAKKLLPPLDQFAVNERQRRLLLETRDSLQEAVLTDDWLIIAEHLRCARVALDSLTGRAHTEEMLDTLFGRFCVGK